MNALPSARTIHLSDDRAPTGHTSLLATLRAVAVPSNVALAGSIVFGWLALVTWTGAGPDGWQARSCADLDLGRPSCSILRTAKDQSRLTPVVAGGTVR